MDRRKYEAGLDTGSRGGRTGRRRGPRADQPVCGDFPEISILALGTNAVATANMIKGGAADGATGENAVALNVGKVDILAGPIGILMPNGLLGELTPRMAEAIGTSDAVKILIPSRQCRIRLADGANQTMKFYLEEAGRIFEEEIRNLEEVE